MATLPVDTLPVAKAPQFKPYGSCIYCGATGALSREHIFPFALGGTLVLPAASCPRCASITSKFEREVLRGPMWAVRAHLQLQSRRRSLAPKTAPLTIIRAGKEVQVDLPLPEHPLLLMFPDFAEPSIFTGNHVKGISMRGHATYTFGTHPQRVMQVLGATDFKLTQEYRVVPFAQLLGKIGWAMAAAEGRLNSIDRDQSVIRALLEQPDDIGRWVGTFPEEPARHEGRLHTAAPMHLGGYLVYHIQLFADAGTPRYGVVIGRLTQ